MNNELRQEKKKLTLKLINYTVILLMLFQPLKMLEFWLNLWFLTNWCPLMLRDLLII